MSEIHRLVLGVETVAGIRDVLSLAGADIITITGSRTEVSVTAYTNNIFKHYTFKREEAEIFSLRLYNSQLSQILQSGCLTIQLESDVVTMAMYDSKEDIGDINKIQKLLRFNKQEVVDHQLATINNVLRVLTNNTKKITLFSAQDILSIANFVKSDHSGVVVKDCKVFTHGEGYYVYAGVDAEQMEIAFPSPVLKPLIKYLRKYHKSSVEVYENDNWVLFVFGGTVFGFVAGRVDTVGGLEAVDSMEVFSESYMDLKNVYNTLKATPVNKATQYSLRFSPSMSSMVLSEARRGDYMIKVPTAKLKVQDEVMEDFNLPIHVAKIVVPILALDYSSRVHVKDYGTFVSMRNQDNVVLLIIKGE